MPATGVVERRASAPTGLAPNAVTPDAAVSGAPAGAATDSLFDHAEDVEFVLDPVTMRHGRATVSRPLPEGVRTERAVVSF